MACAKTLFVLRTLRQHGQSTEALQVVFQATAVSRPRRPGGDSPTQKTRRVWNNSWPVRSDSAIGQQRVQHSTTSAPRLTNACSERLAPTQDTCCTRCFHHHVTITMISEIVITTLCFLLGMLYTVLNYFTYSQNNCT